MRFFRNTLIFNQFLFAYIRHRIGLIINVLVAILLIAVLTFSIWWFSFVYAPLVNKNQSAIDFVYSPGTPAITLAYNLKRQKIIKYPKFFVWLIEWRGVEHVLKAGEYRIDPGLSPMGLLDKMVKGDVIKHTFTVVEGWTFKEMFNTLVNNGYVEHTLSGLSNDEIMRRIGFDGENPEGRFAPATYFFSGPTKDVDILRTAHKLMQKKLFAEWQSRAADVPYKCTYEVLIIASLIEKETAVVNEKPLIAGVILHRLAIGMPLQVDPTVIYGLGETYKGKLTHQDLLHDDSYNTYLRRGLPPTPIAMPSETSIYAALHPVVNTALYYVAKGDGSHVFSNTLDEQDAAIKKYLLKK